jgi:hypothetical protein
MSEVEKVTLSQKPARITEHWRPKLVASLNGQEVKLAKVGGSFPGTITMWRMSCFSASKAGSGRALPATRI